MFERIAPERHDTLDEVPEPAENPHLFGHSEAVAMLAGAHRAGKLPHALLFSGPTGIGKSYLACAFVERACRRGYNAGYLRLPRLLQQLAVARGDGSYGRILERLVRFDLLAIDDWLLSPLRDVERRDLVEVIEDRSERASTLIASQLAAKDWHASIGDPNLADAICDRLLHNAHRIELKGPTIRNTRTAPKTAGTPKS